MSAEKYISVTEAKACAMSLLPDPFFRLAAHAVLDATPAAEVEPVMRGQWIQKQMPIPWCYDDVDVYTVCSVCEGVTIDEFSYCPYCGTKMDAGA